MAGRPRKPSARHELEGTARKDRSNPNEPKFTVGAPDKPAHIKRRKVASREWDAIVPTLIAQRVLSPAYHATLESYCLTYADMVDGEDLKCSRRFRQLPAEYQGQVTKQIENAKKELRQWIVQLGL